MKQEEEEDSKWWNNIYRILANNCEGLANDNFWLLKQHQKEYLSKYRTVILIKNYVFDHLDDTNPILPATL